MTISDIKELLERTIAKKQAFIHDNGQVKGKEYQVAEAQIKLSGLQELYKEIWGDR